MDYLSASLLVLGLSVLYRLWRVYTRISIADIPGPDPESFLLGSMPELVQSLAGEVDFRWQERFGGIARFKAPLGDDYLWLSDPKALQYIFQTSGYNFPKQPERRLVSRLVGDHGLTWAEGETHRRQRKVMLPAFGFPESKALLPVFSHYAEQTTLFFKDLLAGAPEEGITIEVAKPITRATLDAIGEAAFDYRFGNLENADNELAKAYSDLLATIVGQASKGKVFFQNLSHYIPMRVMELLHDHVLPGKGLDKARVNKRVAHKVAHELLESKTEALLMGKGSRDVMSILVKANAAETGYARLNHEELISQMRTIMLAGQETTSNTLSWALLELARHPDVQTRLRKEIHAMERTIQERGDTGFTVADLEAMPYFQATVREIFRFNPVVYHLFRMSKKDDVIPLSKPITTLSGKTVTEVPIPKGLRIVVSVAAYNRDKDVWGEDAHVFRPERFLEGKDRKGPTLGVYGNVLTFSGGLRACIGWRFAIYEVQAFLVELISNFQFATTDDCKRIRREACLVMVPMLEGDIGKGAQMPLKVSLAPRDAE